MPNLVKKLRLEHNLTQEELAEKVNVSSRTIISIEKERYKPSLVLAYKLARIFKLSIEELFCLQDYLGEEK
ncbi:helix-turn-helix transcriptional regulator [Lactobacillus sp. ESL0684]|uniref:helix-turn-helix transcriptional regulator n=1 Tax=Lactobacillus sp. ESL0684 TaxID=2983213 RepID=UPI0023F9B44C|nr:helix-turn-helix transcriptional regulator [Lactobacillus sp. ESL0684]WEV43569.1 helix-turn-helix transcriptional regulator [Lactobacillus sp. ESL0684]